MKYVKQIGIILGVTLAGEALSHFLPFPVPAGVYGLFLMLTALMYPRTARFTYFIEAKANSCRM